MARFTEMSVSPAEPLSYLAAELTFEFDKFLPVLWTFFNSTSYCYGRTLSANEFFFFEVFIILAYSAFFFTSEIWIRTFKTLIIG
jgi:hypothetical protein